MIKIKGEIYMKFYPSTPLRLIDVRTGTSQKGNPYTFVKLADEQTFENVDFMLQKDQDPATLQLHTRYNVEVERNDNFYTVALTPEKAK